MRKRKKTGWKTGMKYVAGMMILAVSIAAALFLPGLYASWQDEKIEGQIVLSHRDPITFLDIESLNMAGRLKVLEDAEQLVVQETLWQFFPEDYSGEEAGSVIRVMEQYMGVSMTELVRNSGGIIQKWAEAGMLPEKYSRLVNKENLKHLSSYIVSVDDSYLTFTMLIFYDEMNCLLAVADQEIETIYYAAVLGVEILDDIAYELGYDSAAVLATAYRDGTYQYGAAGGRQPDVGKIADLCGAESAELLDMQEGFEWEVKLNYANYDSRMKRHLMLFGDEFGMSVRLGPERVDDLFYQLVAINGDFANETDIRYFLEAISGVTAAGGSDVISDAGTEYKYKDIKEY